MISLSHPNQWVVSERGDCKPINSVIANSWAQADTHGFAC